MNDQMVKQVRDNIETVFEAADKREMGKKGSGLDLVMDYTSDCFETDTEMGTMARSIIYVGLLKRGWVE